MIRCNGPASLMSLNKLTSLLMFRPKQRQQAGQEYIDDNQSAVLSRNTDSKSQPETS